MRPPIQFRLSRQSILLTPKVSGLQSLVHGICNGQSIRARQMANDPIITADATKQFLYCESAGSSGFAKTIRRSPRTWIQSFDTNQRLFGMDASDIYGVFGHLGYSLSLYAALEALHLGANLACLSGLLPRGQVQSMIRNGPSVLYATPTQLRRLIAGADALGTECLNSVRYLFVGGGKLDHLLRLRLSELFPLAHIREFYGTSETSFITISDHQTPEGSVGRPYPEVSVEIQPIAPAGSDASGEIWVSSPYLFEGYESGFSEDTRQRADRFLSVGDMGYRDPDGYLYLQGRKNRMVTIADVNVYPEEIERIILRESAISCCAVIPQPDPQRGHRMVAILEGMEDAQHEKRIRRCCREEIHGLAVPHRFLYWDRIPLLLAGKPDYRVIHKRLECGG